MKLFVNTDTSVTGKGGIGRKIDELKSYIVKHKQNIELYILQFGENDRKYRTESNVIIYEVKPELKSDSKWGVYGSVGKIEDLYQRFDPFIKKIRQILLEIKPDAVTIEGTFWAPWCLYHAAKSAMDEKQLPKIPLILDYAGILSEEIKHYPPDLRKVLSLMEKDFNDEEMFYIFPSNLTKEKVEGIFGHQIKNSTVIPNGVSDIFFEEQENSAPNGIGYVGRDSHVKNIGFMPTLKRALEKSGKNRDMHVVSDFRNASSKEELIAHNIRIHGWKNKKALKKFYGNRSVMISPSHFETFGIAPLESIACGTPNIISENMGVREVYEDLGLDSHVLNISDVSQVIRRIEDLEGKRIKRCIRRKLRKRYSWQKIMPEYAAAIERR